MSLTRFDSKPSFSMEAPDPEVSIIIPFHNCRELTMACLGSIFDHTTGITYEIILVDDASDESLDLVGISTPFPVHLIQNKVRKNFSANNNLAASLARGKFLCLLNNDTLVTPGWLKPMVAILLCNPDIGVLGNKQLFPETEKLHHCGMAFDDNGLPWHLHPHTDPSLPAVNYQRDLQIVTFACVLIPKRVYQELGGLDETFHNGFEDCDFCLRVRSAGYRVTYTPASTIYHYGQSTPGRQVSDEENKKLFLTKWQGKIEPDLIRISQEDQDYNQRQLKRPRYRPPLKRGVHLAIDLSQANAFTWAGVDLALALFQLGEPVTLLHGSLNQSIEPRQARVLRSLMSKNPQKRFQVKWSHYDPRTLKQSLNGEINAEIFCTNYRYRIEGRSLDLWMRNVQVNGYRKFPVSSFNQEALLEVDIPLKDCSIMPLGYSPEIDHLFPEGRPRPSSSDPDLHILVVTNSHDLYRYGTDLLIRALGQAFDQKDPVVVHIKDYGGILGSDPLGQWIRDQKYFPRVVWHRQFLTKDDLIRLYAQMDILVAPFRGEGFGMKILDAMALGLPVLMPAFGGPADFCTEDNYLPLPFDEVEVGECLDRRLYFIGRGTYWCQPRLEELTLQLRSLPHRRDELIAVGKRARDQVHKRFSWINTADRLRKALMTWEQERTARVSVRRGPDTLPLSVIIPTREREEILAKAIQGYQKQSLPADQFEIILVNDHGPQEKLKSLVQGNPVPFPLRLLENKGPEWAGAARNLAIEQARGEILLITGDDIVPDRHFLREHLDGHRRFPQLESALVGLTLWHPELRVTPFMEIITGKNGQQFDYTGLRHNHKVSPNRFFTSNVSLKRAFLIEEEALFCTYYAAYEDIELAFRLHQRGMVLRYIETAKGYHYHPTSFRTFVERQRKVGRMLTLFSIQRPDFDPYEHAPFLRVLEFIRSSGMKSQFQANQAGRFEKLIEVLIDCYDSMLDFREQLKDNQGRDIVDGDARQWRRWLNQGSIPTWESINELLLRSGMAEEWASNKREAEEFKDWLLMLTLPRYLGPSKIYAMFPFTKPDLSTKLSNSKIIFWTAETLRKIPFFRSGYRWIKNSRPGQVLQARLKQVIQR